MKDRHGHRGGRLTTRRPHFSWALRTNGLDDDGAWRSRLPCEEGGEDDAQDSGPASMVTSRGLVRIS